MPVIRITTPIHAPPERCFDLARSVGLHVRSTHTTGETVTGDITSGLLELGQSVTFQARHLGVWQTLTSQITAFERPRHFRDSQVRGAFRRFDHDHFFASDGAGGCVMTDVWDYDAPLGWLGRLAEVLFLTAYLRRFLEARCRIIKAAAEGDEWQLYLGTC